ncbi:MAG: PD-(D/E)XK motif protein [Bacteroidales bacterium]|uniref:PD-(D/E)XK motif protein n=1 Tax=Porphyromonas sp. TaxID=1924944 RepID=UPI00297835DD|nr:PD-(D/E)XK motif protein [Porphyromonas sp.]MDD7438195.1 PD-(D/E)XK motif protein [Bacteroidales bacterium]MDY3066842.1 PD-(D/E)XK motif protein [Porphyromonas sp.]
MKKLFEEYKRLVKKCSYSEKNYYDVAEVAEDHKFGVSAEGYPLFFIAIKEDGNTPPPVNLKHLKVRYNQQCTVIHENGMEEVGIYCMIQLTSTSESLCRIFLNIFQRYIEGLGDKSNAYEIKEQIDLYVALFMGLYTPAQSTVQGLWAELFLIACSEDPNYMINVWHANNYSKFDFDDGVCRIEVKSTGEVDSRKHKFSHQQLIAPVDGGLFVASMPVIQNDAGVSIGELIEKIRRRNIDFDSEYKLYKLVIEVLGSDEENFDYYFFDERVALEMIRFYDSKDIPKLKDIPSVYSGITFYCDFASIAPVSLEDYCHYNLISNIKF